MKKQILLLETIAESAHQLLAENFGVHLSDDPYSGATIAAEYPIHAIVTRGKGAVNDQLIAACEPLEVIARCGVGLDNIDVGFASNQQIPVINAPNINASTVAEHTLALILMLQRQLFTVVTAVKIQRWYVRNRYNGDEIRGKMLGVVGLGNIGLKVAHLAKAFGMNVQYWDISDQSQSFPRKELKDLLRTSDIITLHLPLVKATHHLIGSHELALMRPHALLINTARGGIIDQQALQYALLKGRIGGFAADVLEKEPPAYNEDWLALPNVLVTPHNASLTATTYNDMCVTTVNNVIDILQGRSVDPHFVFNRRELETYG